EWHNADCSSASPDFDYHTVNGARAGTKGLARRRDRLVAALCRHYHPGRAAIRGLQLHLANRPRAVRDRRSVETTHGAVVQRPLFLQPFYSVFGIVMAILPWRLVPPGTLDRLRAPLGVNARVRERTEGKRAGGDHSERPS